jgi:ketosteroid isomerase-like protein
MKCLTAISITSMAATALLFPYGRAVGFENDDIAPASATANINERYKVETVAIRNWRGFLSRRIEREMRRMEGRFFKAELLESLAKQIQYEFPGYEVERKVERGSRPEFVRVMFDLEKKRKTIDFRSPRVLVSSTSGFSAAADANIEAGRLSSTVGFITDNDQRVERFTGYRGGVLVPLGNGRVKLGLLGESYRAQWDAPLANDPEIYRTRSNIEPSVVVEVAPGLQLHAGLSLNRLEMQVPAAGDLAANALFTTLRYNRQWQHGLTGTKTLVAGYDLRAAATNLGSDYSYRRHTGEIGFKVSSDNASLSVNGLIGGIDGAAPLLDRFVLGNSRTLRGWNRFELAPRGANRMAHLSFDGRYQHLRLCYDTGTIWDEGRPTIIRHSAGLGFTIHGWTAMVAVPLRGGSIEPVFLVGMNF